MRGHTVDQWFRHGVDKVSHRGHDGPMGALTCPQSTAADYRHHP